MTDRRRRRTMSTLVGAGVAAATIAGVWAGGAAIAGGSHHGPSMARVADNASVPAPTPPTGRPLSVPRVGPDGRPLSVPRVGPDGRPPSSRPCTAVPFATPFAPCTAPAHPRRG